MIELLTYFGFFNTQEIVVESIRVNFPKTTDIMKFENKHSYSIFCPSEGRFRVFCCGKSFDLDPGDIFIAMPFENFNIVYVYDNTKFEDDKKPIIKRVEFASNSFDGTGDENYLRAFNNRKKGENCHYKSNDFVNCIKPIDIFSFLKSCTDKNLSFVHFKSLVAALITVLDVAFDKKHVGIKPLVSTEYDVKIWDYILNNCLSKISAETVEKEFNVSKWYLDKVTNKFYGKPFKKTINALRLWHAKTIIKQNIPLSDVATLGGFANYSTFYRAYTNFFDISPKDDYMHFKNNSIFYSDEKSKER